MLREVVDQDPQLYEVAYSLGLLLAEMKKYKDAENYLEKAAAGMGYGRAHYNHGQVLLILDQPEQAEQALIKALSLEPNEEEFFVALVDFYLKSGQQENARSLAQATIQRFPNHAAAQQVIELLKRQY